MKKLTKYFMVTLGIALSIIIFASANTVYAKTNNTVKIDSFKDQYIKEAIEKYDKNDDGYLNKKELKKVTRLDLEKDGEPFDFEGIGNFKYLKELNINNCCTESVKNIKDIYKLTNLKTLNITACKLEKGTKLNLSNLKKLESLSLYVTNLKSLNLKGNKKLETLVMESDVKKLDLRKNKKLRVLEIRESRKLKTINLKKNKNLEDLTLSGTNSKYSLKYNKKLKTLNIIYAKMPDISKNAKLKKLDLFHPTNKKITIGKGNKQITDIFICKENNRKAMKVSIDGCKNIKSLTLSGDNGGVYKDIKITNCKKIKDLVIIDCTVKNIECDISYDAELWHIVISDKEIAESKLNVKVSVSVNKK